MTSEVAYSDHEDKGRHNMIYYDMLETNITFFLFVYLYVEVFFKKEETQNGLYIRTSIKMYT